MLIIVYNYPLIAMSLVELYKRCESQVKQSEFPKPFTGMVRLKVLSKLLLKEHS